MRLQYFQTIFLSVVILSFFAFLPFSDAFAAELTKPVLSPSTTVTYRDITNLDPTPDPSLSLDKEKYRLRETATLSLNDTNANLDIGGIDFAFAIVDGSSITLTESEINNGAFTGTFEVQGQPSVSYDGDSLEAPRAKITLPLSAGGNVQLSDVEFTENELVNLGIKPIIGAINVDLTDGATFSSLPTVELSYANANIPPATSIHNIQMWYKAPGQSWELITLSNQQLGFSGKFLDETAMTVKSDPKGLGFKNVDGQGAFVLAFDTGVPGGGGGGLVRPSLVVNALAGLGSFGGGADGSPPLIELSELIKFSYLEIPLEIEQMVLNHDSAIPISPMQIGLFEGFEYPMTINDQGFVLGGFTSTIETQTIKTNSTAVIKFILYETTKIQHLSLYTNLRDTNSQIHQSDTQILYNDAQELQIKDPNGFFSNVSVTVNEINENKKEAVFEITFANTMDTSHIIIRSWDPFFNSRDAIILDAIKVVPEIAIESPVPTFEEPQIEELKSQSIPIWIKNNAAWWSEQQISDSDFVAGIEYLIKNGIINVPGIEVNTSSTTEIPDWIQNNAGWWADSLITDNDFTEAMQWLVVNGVIQI